MPPGRIDWVSLISREALMGLFMIAVVLVNECKASTTQKHLHKKYIIIT